MFDAELKGWRAGCVGDLVREVVDRVDPGQMGDSNQPYVGLEHIAQGTGMLSGVGCASEVVSQKSRFQPGDILYGKLRPNLRKVARPDFGGVCSTDIVVFRAKAEADADFAFQLLQSDPVVAHAVASSAGTKMPRTHARSVMAFETALPPLDEQRRIANVLRSSDAVVGAQGAVVEKLREVQSATFTAFLRSGDGCEQSEEITEWVTGRIEGVRKLPPGWKLVRLVDVAKLESGHTPSRKEPSYWDGGQVGWISLHDTKNLERLEIHSSELMITELGLKNSSARLLPAGTVCFSRTATVGKCVVMGRSMATSQDFANFVCSDLLNNRYLLYLMRWMQPVWKQLSSGSTHKTIYMPTFESLQIVLPPREVQNEIVATMDSLTCAIERGSASLHQQQRARSALMGDLLSGRVRVPV